MSTTKRKGRPPKTRTSNGSADPVEGDTSDSYDDENFSDEDNASNKKRGRSKPQTSSSVKLYWDDSDIDEEGEKKIDKNGHLLEGRQYKVATFEIPGRGNELFIFSKDLLDFSPKCRDSFVLLKKNPKLKRVFLTEEEKLQLVQDKVLRATFVRRNTPAQKKKGSPRDVSIVTARSAFKLFGYRLVLNGRRGRDDYYNTGEIEDDSHDSQEEELRDDAPITSWTAGTLSGRNNLTNQLSHRSDVGPLNETNWMYHAALSLRTFNAQVIEYRRSHRSFYDVHSNAHQIPSAKQAIRSLESTRKS